jgi:hypothetical protein
VGEGAVLVWLRVEAAEDGRHDRGRSDWSEMERREGI